MPTTVERQKLIDDLFDQALDVPADRVGDFLTQACEGDPEIRAAVERLLSWSYRPPSLFNQAAMETTALLQKTDDAWLRTSSLTPKRIGPYRVLEEVGRGGMGVVYRAARDDGHFDQVIAIKVIQPGLDTPEALRRFAQERQIIASLNHPNIARLYDGGMTHDGRPFFAMELVEGQPITDHCDDHQLDLDERLRLFQIVAEAVHDAHRNLVIHRDLKPTNIIVSPRGDVKLLDFGIAKLLPGPGTPHLDHTRTHLRPMTPIYASPEQLRGDSVTTASDVFQLGLLLFRLLSGQKARQEATDTPVELMAATWLDAPIPRMSTALKRAAPEQLAAAAANRALSASALQRKLEGDLDIIVQAALRPEPDRRYASAKELANDIQRFRENFPIAARSESLAYRTRRFLGRNPLAAALGGSLLLFLLIYTVTLTIYARRITEERDRAETIKTFALDLYSAADPNRAQGPELSAAELVAFGAQRVEELTDQPEVQAQLCAYLGDVYARLGEYEESESLLQKTLSLRQTIHNEDHPEIATAMHNLGVILLERDAPEAFEYLRGALEIRQRAFGREHVETAESLMLMGQWHREQSDYDKAKNAVGEAVDIFRRTVGEQSDIYATGKTELGLLNRRLRRYEDAEIHLREALVIYRALYGDNHPQVATAFNNYGAVLWDMENYEAGDEAMLKSLGIQENLYGDVHADIATSLSNMAGSFLNRNDLTQAVKYFRRAYEMRRQVFGEDHPRVGQSATQLAEALHSNDQLNEATVLLEEALGIFRTHLPPGHWSISRVLRSIGDLSTDLREHERSENSLREAREILENLDDTFGVAIVDIIWAKSHRQQGQFWQAHERLQAVLPQREGLAQRWRQRLDEEIVMAEEALREKGKERKDPGK